MVSRRPVKVPVRTLQVLIIQVLLQIAPVTVHLLLSSLPDVVDKNASSDSRNAVDCAFGLLLKLIPQISAHSREYGGQTGVSIHGSS